MARKFDRIIHFDERSRNYPIRAVVAKKKPRSYTWKCPVWLDQGNEGACVGFGWSHELAGKPVPVPGITNKTAQNLYEEAKKIDEWPGEAYDGTSVLAGAKTVQSEGYIKEYRWAFGLDDLILAVGHAGPVVLGLNWYEGMEETDDKGFVEVTGSVLGGHCIVCIGVNVKKEYFTLHNSWGKNWGIDGECKVSFEDMKILLDDDGECCIPLVRKRV